MAKHLSSNLPLLSEALSFASGIIISHINLNLNFVAEFFFFYLIYLIIFKSYAQIRKFILIGFLLLGILYGSKEKLFEPNHIARFPSQATEIEGKVVSLVNETKEGRKRTLSFVLDAKSIRNGSRRTKTSGLVQVTVLNIGKKFQTGDFIRLRGSLETPRDSTTPGQFNYQKYLAQNRIYKTFFAVGYKSTSVVMRNYKPTVMDQIEVWRYQIKQKFDQLFPYPENTLASALLLGVRKGIPTEIRDAFVKTGTVHLLAISGLNVTLMIGCLYGLMRLSGFLPRKWTAVIAILASFFYAGLAGANPPVIRATIMVFLALLGVCIEKDSNFLNSLLIAFFLILLVNPESLFATSFQLSFISVYFLAISTQKEINSKETVPESSSNRIMAIYSSVKRKAQDDLKASFTTLTCLIPIILYYFNIVSPVSLIANMIAGPLLFLANIGLFLALPFSLISTLIAEKICIFPTLCFKMTCAILSYLSNLPGSYFYLRSPSLLIVLIYYFILLFAFILIRKHFWKIVFVSSVIFTFALRIDLDPAQYKCHFIDVGKSNVLLIEGKHENILLVSPQRNFAAQNYWTIRPFLMSQGINQIDHLIIAANTKSFLKPLQFLKKNFKISKIYPATADLSNFKITPIQTKKILTGYHIQFEHQNLVYLTALKPDSLKILNDLNLSRLNLLFIPHVPEEEFWIVKKLLKKLSPDFVISNQRNLVGLMSKITFKQKIFFLSRTGTVSAFINRASIQLFPFKTKSDKIMKNEILKSNRLGFNEKSIISKTGTV